jgi:hypothetical protein
MARMAGEVFHQTMTQREKPIVPGFNSEDLVPTPELPKATPKQQLEKDSYILNNPRSGVARNSGAPGQQMAFNPTQLLNPFNPAGAFIRKAVQGEAVGDGTVFKGQPDPFQENNKIRPSDSDDQFMDVMRTGFV